MSWDSFAPARHLSSASTAEILRLLIDSEAAGAALPAGEIGRIERFVDEGSARLAHGGVLRLVAAGPSAHLVRFAAEETGSWFRGVLPIEVLTATGEALEEDAIALVDEVVAPDDVVMGVSRSGSRPWTCVAIRKSNMIGALTSSISCMPDNAMSRESDMPIVVTTGAEVVIGCTQYRAGTAVKVALDAILLALAARAGGLWGNVPVKADIEADAWRFVAAAAGVDHLQARSVLARAEGDVVTAVVMAKLGVDIGEARRRLAEADGRLDRVIGAAGFP